MTSRHRTESGRQIDRRQFVRAGGLGALSLLGSDLLRVGAAVRPSGKAKARSVILIYNCGAASHLDLWDMKPDAPDSIRGEFKPVATNVPGIRISELMPHLTRHADKFSIIRTVNHRHTSHNAGMYWSIVGRPYEKDEYAHQPEPG